RFNARAHTKPVRSAQPYHRAKLPEPPAPFAPRRFLCLGLTGACILIGLGWSEERSGSSCTSQNQAARSQFCVRQTLLLVPATATLDLHGEHMATKVKAAIKPEIKPEIKERHYTPRTNFEADLALEFLRVVEESAIASAKTMGQGKRELADKMATEAMRKVMDSVPM